MEEQREEDDFALALHLQALWEAEDEEAAAARESLVSSPHRPLSVVDETWELLDPSPDVHALFVQFNEALFWGRLAAVEVSWSPRMTLCAGTCTYEGRGGRCSIRLSKPLLKFRPRKDLVETLLHEMIHALLFVTHNDKDRQSHGPEFCKHMRRINRLTGANVTIYHDFYDEVDLYRQHWWRCNGPCQNRKPYFGYVKRSMNRPPSARDFWWAEHQVMCGGTFTKVREPENFSTKSKGKTQPTERPTSEATNRDKTQTHNTHSPVPFSGKGYQLGGDNSSLSVKNPGSSSSVGNSETPASQDRSRAIPVPKNEIKFDKSPPSSIFFSLNTDTSEKINLASKREFPKLSAANTKAYEDLGELPVKIARVREEKSTQGSADGKRLPKPIYFKQTVTSEVASQKNSPKAPSTQQQCPERKERSAFENYFIQNWSTDATSSVKTPITKTKAEPTVPPASSRTAGRLNKKVSCPVCQTEVFESEINEHLDACLA